MESQGRGRAHRRIQHPQAYTLAVDLSGKLAAGKDQRCQAKYFVAAVYTYLVDGKGRSLLAEPQEEAEPEAGDLEVEVDMPEEKDEREQMPEEEVEKEIKAGDIWEKMVGCGGHQLDVCGADHIETGVGCHSGDREDLRKAQGDGSAGLQVAHGPSPRTDGSAVETLGAGQEHCEDHGSGEAEIRVLKRATRTLLKAGGEPATLWPMALRRAGERCLRRQLHAVGLPVKEMLPWGTRVGAKKARICGLTANGSRLWAQMQ